MMINITKNLEREFKEPKLFKLEFNDLHNTVCEYDIITSFNITHIFDNISMKYLIDVTSNKSKYCYLHINPEIITCQRKISM